MEQTRAFWGQNKKMKRCLGKNEKFEKDYVFIWFQSTTKLRRPDQRAPNRSSDLKSFTDMSFMLHIISSYWIQFYGICKVDGIKWTIAWYVFILKCLEVYTFEFGTNSWSSNYPSLFSKGKHILGQFQLIKWSYFSSIHITFLWNF